MRVLVTGGGGFIGSHLVDSQLAQGHEVRAVDLVTERLRHAADHRRLEIIRGNIADTKLLPKLMTGVDVVYHLASAHLDVTLPDEMYERVNVAAARELVRAAHEGGVTRFVHVSTNGVVGNISDPPVDETAICRPTNIYEATKLAGEEEVLDYARASNFPLVVIRPAWVYGPRCPRTAKLMRTIAKGRFVMFGDGKTLRHPLYIADAVRGLEQAACAHDAAGQVYFLAGERAVTLNELVATIAEVQGVRPPRLRLPLFMGIAGGYAVQWMFKPLGQQPPISRRTIDFYLKDNAYDIGKARRDLGFAPEVDLRDGLQRTLAAQSGS